MTNRMKHLLFLCRCLSPAGDASDNQRLAETMHSGDVSWELLAEVAGEYLLIPTLWHELSRKGLTDRLPPDFAEFLAVVYQANVERNQALKAQIATVVRSLNSCHVEPILLKGASHLATGTDEDLRARMLSDIDLLVPAGKLETALTCLLSAGYFVDPAVTAEEGCQHLDPLFHPDERARIELHMRLHTTREPAVITESEWWTESQLVEKDGGRFRLLSPVHGMAYHMFHTEFHHSCYSSHEIAVRRLWSFTRTVADAGGRIDWTRVRGTLARHGMAPIFDAYILRVRRLFGLSIPGLKAGGWAARLHLRRCLAKKRWDELSFPTRSIRTLRLLFSAPQICNRFGCSDRWTDLTRHRLVYAAHLVKKFVFGARRSILADLLSGGDSRRPDILADYDSRLPRD